LHFFQYDCCYRSLFADSSVDFLSIAPDPAHLKHL
jgi:hypothetical protein